MRFEWDLIIKVEYAKGLTNLYSILKYSTSYFYSGVIWQPLYTEWTS